MKVEYNVNEEDHVDNAVNHQEDDIIDGFAAKGRIEWHHHGGVAGEEEDHPIPCRLEGHIVENHMRRGLWRFLFVRWYDVHPGRERLKAKI